jgi:hypothetical protein
LAFLCLIGEQGHFLPILQTAPEQPIPIGKLVMSLYLNIVNRFLFVVFKLFEIFSFVFGGPEKDRFGLR